VVLIFVRCVIGSVVLFVLLTVNTRLRPLKLGCCAELVVAIICDGVLVMRATQLIVGILVSWW
jgi:hypothetical protein